MNIYLAPLEGITRNIYRTHLNRVFGGVDKFFTPFISPSEKGVLSTKTTRDVLPENNIGQELIPQILTNSSEGFLTMCKRLSQYGYEEFNLNLGCPSGTVVSKGRGAGFLAFPDELDRFLDEIFKGGYKISVKTRIGMSRPDEFYRLLEIFEKYPLTELIIHPRTRKDMYKNKPDIDMFCQACTRSKHRLCYNGDIFTVADYGRISACCPETENFMIGRGVIADPALPRKIKGGKAADAEELREFYNSVYADYEEVLSGGTHLLHKMKELMLLMLGLFEDTEKIGKKIKKAKNLNEFNAAVTELFSAHPLK